VPIDAYREQVKAQSITRTRSRPPRWRSRSVTSCFPAGTIERLGPAANSGKAILLYGAPGNGKTSIAMAIGAAFDQSIFLPYCIEADGQIIRLFDPERAPARRRDGQRPRGRDLDPRWLHCHRPVVVTGGELTIEMLDLCFDPISKFYEAPAHMKATGGVFIADDLGRQRVQALDLVNRWILPLERRIDFLTLHTGKKIELPVRSAGRVLDQHRAARADRRRGHAAHPVQVPRAGAHRRAIREILRQICDDLGVELPDGVVSVPARRFLSEDRRPDLGGAPEVRRRPRDRALPLLGDPGADHARARARRGREPGRRRRAAAGAAARLADATARPREPGPNPTRRRHAAWAAV
jgi:hypothetical protein